MAFDWNAVDGYREDMTADEKLALLENYNPNQPAAAPEPAPAADPVPEPAPAPAPKLDKATELMNEVKWKRERDKLTSENANLKRQLRSRMSEEEAREADRKAEMEARDAELEALRRDKTLSNLRASFIGRGFDENMAQKAAEAFADSDAETLFDVMARRDLSWEKNMRAKILAETPKPPASDPNSEEFKKIKEYDNDRMDEYKEEVKEFAEDPCATPKAILDEDKEDEKDGIRPLKQPD